MGRGFLHSKLELCISDDHIRNIPSLVDIVRKSRKKLIVGLSRTYVDLIFGHVCYEHPPLQQ